MQTSSTDHPKWGIFAPLFSLVIYVVGHGLLTTLLTVRLSLSDTSPTLIGMVSTAYFGGLVAGTFVNSRIISRIGHIRAYAAYASILASIAILFGLIHSAEIWIVLRFISGFATGGLLVVIESWMLVSSRPEIRGRVMALYMILFYGALAAGQLLLKIFPPDALEPLTLVAMAASLSVVPLAFARVDMPKLETQHKLRLIALIRKTPAGLVSGFNAGMLLGVVYGLLPLFFAEIGYDLSQTANMMVVIIIGGVIWQYPLGRLSDHFDRRIVLAILFSAIAALSVTYILLSAATNVWLSAALLFVAGGMFFAVYPISLSHACDELSQGELIEANQGLLLCYSVGAMVGPLLAPLFMSLLSPAGIFWYFSLLASLAAAFLLWRLMQRSAVPIEQHEAFSMMAPTTPVSVEFHPLAETTEQTAVTNPGEEPPLAAADLEITTDYEPPQPAHESSQLPSSEPKPGS